MAKVIDTQEQIEKCLNCKRPKCNNCVIPNNSEKRKAKHTQGFIEADFYRLYNLGYSDFEIAETLGVPRQNVTSYRNRRKLKVNKFRNSGERKDDGV